ncbi:leucine-rich PPR motif-containing protein, mitochondrial [Diabrotica undecimpunctata]|uniref:leucine-rich PPR motif-containing protein, mitochondrial n=1 Tax=Diabrotica undecimpunctata TaxID=50387 RepID=UPI003B632C1D
MLRQHNFIFKYIPVVQMKCSSRILGYRNFFRYLKTVSPSSNKLQTLASSISEYKQGQKQLDLNVLTDIYKNVNFESISNDEGQVLLQCCGSLAINSSQQERNKLCQNIYGNLAKHNKLDVDVYNTYIEICTQNRTLINFKQFLENLKCELHKRTYMLLFQNVCECGDISQAFLLLEMMKSENIPVDEEIFNNLVLVHTLNGGIEAAENVLGTMKAAQVLETTQTHVAILKGVIRNKNHSDLKKILAKYYVQLDEDQLLLILKEIGLNGVISWLPEMNPLFKDLSLTRDFINNLKNICVHFVHMSEPYSAMKMFNYFQQEAEEHCGIFILEEMLHSNIEYDECLAAVKFFCDNYTNEYVYERLTEVALKNEYYDIAWRLFEHLQALRPHFFWPLFLNARNVEGEAGIFKVLDRVKKLGVQVDTDTVEYYILPFCNLEDVKSVVEKMKKEGFTVVSVLGPLVRVLLKGNKIKKAAELCEHYKVNIGGDKLFHLICTSWRATKSPLLVTVLKKYCESNNNDNDTVGDFLVKSLPSCKNRYDFHDFSKTLKAIFEAKLKITTTSADLLREKLQEQFGEKESELSEQILDGIDKILQLKLKTEKSYIPHPREMSVEELECHLVELTEKGMETRGTLRKLIQMHVNLGNVTRVEELRKQFLAHGYEESVGMKSSLMHSFVVNGNTKAALNLYNEITTLHPDFRIDNYKSIDLATLLVKEGRLTEAISLVESIEYRPEFRSALVQRNCVLLLNSFKDQAKQTEMFDLLIKKKLCVVNNIMLGPLVRILLERGDLEGAVSTFITFAEKHKVTPLLFELIREIALSQNEDLLQTVLDVSTKVHGPVSTQVMLIAVLAEIGEERILKKLFATTKIPIQRELKKRCERWIKEGKVNALLTLANSCNRVSNDLVDVDFIYQCIIKTFAANNDCEAAVKFYERLLDEDVPVNRKLERDLYQFLKQNNYSVVNPK